MADGIIIHPLNSPRTLAEHNLPQIEGGLSAAGRARSSYTVAAGAILGVWGDETEKARVESALRTMLAFYGSTPAYRLMLDLEGYGELQPELRRLTKEGRWHEMPSLIDDGMLDRFTVRGTPGDVGAALADRFAGRVDRVSLSPQGQLRREILAVVIEAARNRMAEIAAGSIATG